MTGRSGFLALAVLVVLATGGCRSRITGDEGNLAFSYATDDEVRDFNKPIAVGARLDVSVTSARGLRKAQVTGVTTSDLDVLRVVDTSGDAITLEGVSGGKADLQVNAIVAGEELYDQITMTARVPEVLKLSHVCTSERRALYLVDSDVLVPYEFEMRNGQPVIGYGHFPITITPAGMLTLRTDSKNQAAFELRTGSSTGEVTIDSDIDDHAITLRLVEAGDVDGARLAGDAAARRIKAGRRGYVLVRPLVGEDEVCQAKVAMNVAGRTPEVCAASRVDTAREDDALGTTWGWVEINGQEPGTCEFDVTFPAARGGEGLTTRMVVEIVK